MADLDSDLDRRSNRRHRPATECELFIGAHRNQGVIADVSRGGAFVRTDARAWPGALVRLRWLGQERFGIVTHLRPVPRTLRWVSSGGIGLRWIHAQR